jgi:hypothetical protein
VILKKPALIAGFFMGAQHLHPRLFAPKVIRRLDAGKPLDRMTKLLATPYPM